MASAEYFALCEEVTSVVVKRSEVKNDSAAWLLSLITSSNPDPC